MQLLALATALFSASPLRFSSRVVIDEAATHLGRQLGSLPVIEPKSRPAKRPAVAVPPAAAPTAGAATAAAARQHGKSRSSVLAGGDVKATGAVGPTGRLSTVSSAGPAGPARLGGVGGASMLATGSHVVITGLPGGRGEGCEAVVLFPNHGRWIVQVEFLNPLQFALAPANLRPQARSECLDDRREAVVSPNAWQVCPRSRARART